MADAAFLGDGVAGIDGCRKRQGSAGFAAGTEIEAALLEGTIGQAASQERGNEMRVLSMRDAALRDRAIVVRIQKARTALLLDLPFSAPCCFVSARGACSSIATMAEDAPKNCANK